MKIEVPDEFDFHFILNEFVHVKNFILQSSEFSVKAPEHEYIFSKYS